VIQLFCLKEKVIVFVYSGLLQGIVDVANAPFYSNAIDFQKSYPMLNNSSLTFESATKDAREGNWSNVKEYLNSIFDNARAFIEKDEVYDREEIMETLKHIVGTRGNFVCLLGGKSVGKSLIFRQLEGAAKDSPLIIYINMREWEKNMNMLAAVVTSLANTNVTKTAKLIKLAPHSFLSKLSTFIGIDGMVDIDGIMRLFQESKQDESTILRSLLKELSSTYGILTIVIDEANLAFDPSNPNEEIFQKVKADLQMFLHC
jgi:hypothetical protein